MRLALIADSFPPQCNSAAVQLRDLSREIVRQGHQLTVMLPTENLNHSWQLEEMDGVQVLRLKAPKIKDVGYIRRTIGELCMPFAMYRHFKKSPVAHTRWDGVIWYAPSIFHAPLANALKKLSTCKSYLIIRDIFPQWALDVGLMRRGLPYWFFNMVARYQYSVANVIGVQTSGNLGYFKRWQKKSDRKLEVLQNWLDNPRKLPCSIRISDTVLSGRKIFVYAGNMGVAQGMDILLDLARKLFYRSDVGFLFVGRGSEVQRLKHVAQSQALKNILFFDEIHPDEIPALYAQCHVGLVALDSRHKSHNIPGKFLTYMQNGLPVLANVNPGNDLVEMIRDERVGQVCDSNQVNDLVDLSLSLLEQVDTDKALMVRCHQLFEREFLVESKVHQILSALGT